MTAASLEVANLSVGYPKRIVLSQINLPPMQAGTITTLIGPNAAGKTTLLRTIARLQAARGGSLLFGGDDLLSKMPSEHARLVSYMPQALPQRVALSVIESVMAALRATPVSTAETSLAATHKAAAEVLDRLGIGHLAFRMLDELSGGQRQLASLAQSIARNPAILLLDEPTSALDPRHQIKVMSTVREIVRERGIVAIVVMHDLNLALDWGDQMVLIGDGAVIAAGPAEQAMTTANLARAYKIHARVERCSRGQLHVFVDAVLAD